VPISKEQFMSFPEEITKCLKGCNVDKVEFNVDFTDKLLDKPISEFLPEIVSELADNCMDKGAKSIVITLTNNSLRVEDDVTEANPEKTLKMLNKIKDAGRVTTTKDTGGGMGIAKIVMGFLNKFGGDLEYSIAEGRIVAEVTWQ
jgi:hypothetical protein